MKKEKSDSIDKIIMDVPLFIRMLEYAKEDAKTDMDLHSATEKAVELSKSNDVLCMDQYDTIIGGKKEVEATEQTMSGSSGSFEAPAFSITKREIYNQHSNKPKQGEFTEATMSDSSGQYDASFSAGRKNPLAIEGPSSIAKSRAVKDKNFPKFGGPGGVYIKIKEKCKKFPYCNQGDINAIETLKESIDEIAKKFSLPTSEVEKIVLKGIKDIFI